MRRTIIIGIFAGAAVLGGAPALAAAPQISQQSCDAVHGTFTRVQGVKTCTVRSGHRHYDAPEEIPGVMEAAGSGEEWQYVGVVRDVTDTTTTTSQRQKGNGPVTTIGPVTTVEQWVSPTDCLLKVYREGSLAEYDSAPFEECEARGLLPAS